MANDTIIDLPANYHGGGAPVTFADGHAELRAWSSADTRFPKQSGLAADKYNLISVAADDPDLAWLRAHATVPE